MFNYEEKVMIGDQAEHDRYTRQGEKHWGELTVVEKIERLREQVRFLQANSKVDRGVLRELLQHQHGPDGKLLIPVRHPVPMPDFHVGSLRDDVYF